MSSIPGSDYFDFAGNGWRPGANEDWARNHRINEQTGELEGDYPLPPADVARGYQAMHDRAVWNYRRRLMDQGRQKVASGTQFQQGALGLLQSYRAGGSAALEAGIYNNVASGMRAEGAAHFQQAQMTQPLDLMGDLRRHEGAIAARRADRANERMFIASLIGNGSVSLSLGGQPSQSGQEQTRFGGSGSDGGLGGGGGSMGDGGSGGDASALSFEQEGMGNSEIRSPLQGGPQPMEGQGQQQGSPFSQSAPQSQNEAPGVKSIVQPFGPPGAATGGQGQPQPGPGAPGASAEGGIGAPGPMAGTMGAPGADGNFSPESFAAASAAAQTGSPLGAMSRVDLNHYLADMYESDRFYQSFPMAIETEWRKRLQTA